MQSHHARQRHPHANRPNNTRPVRHVSRKSVAGSFFAGIFASVLILTVIVCIAIALLYVFDHPSTSHGGAIHTFLPVLGQGSAAASAQSTAGVHNTASPANPTILQPPYSHEYTYAYPAYGQTPDATTLPIVATPFNVFPFYRPENTPLYFYFHRRRPELSYEEVVWKVNAHLHLPFHYYVRINDAAEPLLVNTFYRLPPGFEPPELVPVNNAYCHLRATPKTVEAFHALRAASRENGLDLSVTSAFRPASRQAELFSRQNYVDGVVARPYHSEHQTGRALDLWGPGGLLDARGPSPTGIWVAQNAHLFGFIIRYRAETTHITGFIYEPWHITYVGTEISMYMYTNNILSLEEFVARIPTV